MHVRSDSLADEVRVTLDAGVELANDLAVGPVRVRQILVDHAFHRADHATDAEIDELAELFEPIGRLLRALPATDLAAAVEAVNRLLTAYPVAPSLQAHDGFSLHIHWTGIETSFARQVGADVLMALAQILCDRGTDRFGWCAASGCSRLFYDSTKNRSRRFCSDARCASRTHTASHRARRRRGEAGTDRGGR